MEAAGARTGRTGRAKGIAKGFARLFLPGCGRQSSCNVKLRACEQTGSGECVEMHESTDEQVISGIAECDSDSRSFSRYPASAIPLPFVPAGSGAVVSTVRGGQEMRRHLETLGFVEGAHIAVACETAGNLIVEVKGSRVALDLRTASRVSVVAL